MTDPLKDDIDTAIEEFFESLWSSSMDASAIASAGRQLQARLYRAAAQAFTLGQQAGRLGAPPVDLSNDPESDTEARGRMLELYDQPRH